jgi:predicted AAA+ superfamily ATPase
MLRPGHPAPLRLPRPDKFTALFEYLLKQSGGLLEVARTAGALGISRPTVESHLRALEATHAITVLRPFHGGGQKELVKTPKVYAFDTGFVSFARGWDPLRPEDYGILWEHVVLEYLQAHAHEWRLYYWRDATGREIDFVLPRSRDRIDAIECKWDPSHMDPAALRTFRSYYPRGVRHCPPRHPGIPQAGRGAGAFHLQS